MKRKLFKKSIVILSLSVIIYWLPFLTISFNSQSSIISSIDQLSKSDVVIIFGTLVNEAGDISPLLKERLEAGKEILKNGKAEKIVVSNTKFAAKVMANYLIDQGIDKNLIEIDAQAEKTPDTCKYEKKQNPDGRKIIFISQGFHLPRLIYQCSKLGVKGVAFSAEALYIIDRSEYSFLTKIIVRAKRYFREAALTSLALLNIY